MTAGWQVVCFAVAFVAFVLAAVVAFIQAPRAWWPTLISVGLAAATLVALWNANSVYD